MSVVIGFAEYVIKCSGLVLSVLISSLALTNAHSGRGNSTLARQTFGFLVLFLIAIFVYVVM